jgi:hypothetical protein
MTAFFENPESHQQRSLRGLEIPLFPPNEEITLLPAMELRMDAQLLGIREIRGGGITGAPVDVPPDVTRAEAQKEHSKDTKRRHGIPPKAPLPEGIAAPAPARGTPLTDADMEAGADELLNEEAARLRAAADATE